MPTQDTETPPEIRFSQVPTPCTSTVAQVAAHFQVSVDTIEAWTKHPSFPCMKIGRQLRFNIGEVEAWAKLQWQKELKRTDDRRRTIWAP